MTDRLASQIDVFHSACMENDLKRVRDTITPSVIDAINSDGRTALHIACSRGYTELVQLLFRYHAQRTITDGNGFTAEQLAANDEIKNLFKANKRPQSDSKHFVGTTGEVEWLDSYKNAYRIAFENLQHMKRWILKVPLNKLTDELLNGYLEKMKFASEKSKEETKDYFKIAIEWEQLVGFILAYTSGGNGFCTLLNYDLAALSSDFRFLSTQSLFESGYLDNEAPKGLGQYIFTAIIINHPAFRSYQRAGVTYRGMSVTENELKQYKEGDIVMTRSFLSTSRDDEMAKRFIPPPTNHDENPSTDMNEKQPLMCIYEVVHPSSSLAIEDISNFPPEQEVLIAPFTVFQVTKMENVQMNLDTKSHSVKVIYLKECD